MSTMALELEAIPEYEDELEMELEWEGELESEEFFRRLAGLAQRAVRSPLLRRAAAAAARSAVGGVRGTALAGPPGSRAGAAGGAALGRVLADLLPRPPRPAVARPRRRPRRAGQICRATSRMSQRIRAASSCGRTRFNREVRSIFCIRDFATTQPRSSRSTA